MFLLAGALLLGCVGCSKNGVTREEIDELKQQYEYLQNRLDELDAGNTSTTDTTKNPYPTKDPSSGSTDTPEETDEPCVSGEMLEFRSGTNQNDSMLLPVNTKVYGTVSDGLAQWFAFTTSDREDSVYSITAMSKSYNTCDLEISVVDRFGTDCGKFYSSSANCAVFKYDYDYLEPNTTYYIRICLWKKIRSTIC